MKIKRFRVIENGSNRRKLEKMSNVLTPQDDLPPKIVCPMLNFARPVGSCMTRCEMKDVNWCRQIKKVPIEDLDDVVPLLREDVSVEAWQERRPFFLEPVKEERASKDEPFDERKNGGGGLMTRAELGEEEPEEEEPVAAAVPDDEDDIPLGPRADGDQRANDLQTGNVQRTSADGDDNEPPNFDDGVKTADDQSNESSGDDDNSGGETDPGTIPTSKKKTRKKGGAGSKKKTSKSSSKGKGGDQEGSQARKQDTQPAGPVTMVICVLDTWCQVLEFEEEVDTGALMEAAAEMRGGLLSFHSQKMGSLEEEGDDETEEGQQTAEMLAKLQDEEGHPTRIFQAAAEFRAQVVTTLEQV